MAVLFGLDEGGGIGVVGRNEPINGLPHLAPTQVGTTFGELGQDVWRDYELNVLKNVK